MEKRMIWTDSIVHDSRALEHLVGVIGDERVIFGTDYPFPLGEVTGSAEGIYPGVCIDETESLSDDLRTRLFSDNCLEFLGVKREDFIRGK